MADFDVEDVLKKLTVSEKVDLLAGNTAPVSFGGSLFTPIADSSLQPPMRPMTS